MAKVRTRRGDTGPRRRRFDVSGAGFGHDTTHSIEEYEAAKAIGIPAKYYETFEAHRDPLEAWNELMRSAEGELGTSSRAEVGEIESYADTPDDSSPVDLGNQISYPERISASVIIPDSKNKLWSLTGAIYRNRAGGWRAGAELDMQETA